MFATWALLLAQAATEPSSSTTKAGELPGWLQMLLGCCCMVGFLGFFVTMLAAQWKIYAKAGQPGWSILIPIYGPVVGMRIIGRPWYRWLLYYVPIWGFPYLAMMDLYVLLQCFGKGTGFFLGTLFFPWLFIPMLGFGKAIYSPPIPDVPPVAPPPRPVGGVPRPPAGPPRPPAGPPRPSGPPRR